MIAELYPWWKALHILAVIAWMAGMLYLPRLYAYHAAALAGDGPGGAAGAPAVAATLTVMERRLLRLIMTPAMIATWILGILTTASLGAWPEGWLHAKLLLVLILSGLHGLFAAHGRAFASGTATWSARRWKIVNEVPAVLTIGIVVLVVIKPF